MAVTETENKHEASTVPYAESRDRADPVQQITPVVPRQRGGRLAREAVGQAEKWAEEELLGLF